MATKWKTYTFVKAWLEGTLGKKRVHGSYRVLEGDHCTLLVKACTSYRVAAGSKLMGINLSTDEHKVCFYHQYNTTEFRHGLTRDLDLYSANKLPSGILDGKDENLLKSGIIAVDDETVLIEIGDKPYLLHKKIVGGQVMVRDGLLKFSSLDEIPKRVSSISEAQDLIKDPVGMEQLCSTWWVDRQPDNFIPPQLELKYIEVLTNPPSPLKHGYKIDECEVEDRTFKPRTKLLLEPRDARAKSYSIALNLWIIACDKVKNRIPSEYQGLTIKKNKYSYGATAKDRVGEIVSTEQGVFVRGEVHSVENWSDTTRLDRWYKLHTKVNRIKI